MTVQELIDRLNKVSDKSKPVFTNNVWEDWLLLVIEEDDIEEHNTMVIITVDMP